ncbi:hypothetical protein MKOR_16230 [Mycolicibacillus koreensis]|nr:hypothetical protein MKOR_16230 [Mycolicibacillus koreensis]
MFDTPPLVSRRRVLAAAATLAAVGAAGSACAPSAPPEPDVLIAQLDLARGDAALATAAAAAATGATAAALSVVAEHRQAHAAALATEIDRLAAGTASPSVSATTTTAAAAAASVDDVVAALRTAAQSAGKLATTVAGYRAGLLGSIAACCTADHSVTLGDQEAPR